MNDFKPGLEGIVAVETEIAEPDREGGALRYRGVDIEELVGFVPFENLVGRADVIFFSAAVDEPGRFNWTSPWTWPFDVRWRRIFSIVR